MARLKEKLRVVLVVILSNDRPRLLGSSLAQFKRMTALAWLADIKDGVVDRKMAGPTIGAGL